MVLIEQVGDPFGELDAAQVVVLVIGCNSRVIFFKRFIVKPSVHPEFDGIAVATKLFAREQFIHLPQEAVLVLEGIMGKHPVGFGDVTGEPVVHPPALGDDHGFAEEGAGLLFQVLGQLPAKGFHLVGNI